MHSQHVLLNMSSCRCHQRPVRTWRFRRELTLAAHLVHPPSSTGRSANTVAARYCNLVRTLFAERLRAYRRPGLRYRMISWDIRKVKVSPWDMWELANPNYTYAAHHNITSCIVWDCGHGPMKTLAYEEAPVWLQGQRRNTVPLPFEGRDQIHAFADYRVPLTRIMIKQQKHGIGVVSVWSSLGNS